MDGTSNMFDGSGLNQQHVTARVLYRTSLTVKKQQIRLAEQGSGQSQTHAPTTRECPGGVLLSLGGETKTSQDTGRTGLGLVGLHLGELGVNVAQSDIQTLPLMVQSGSIFRGVCHLRPFFFNSRQLLSDFL